MVYDLQVLKETDKSNRMNSNFISFFCLNRVALFTKFDIINAWQHFGNRKSVSQNKLCN